MKNSYALESLSYSGRLVQANGAPVTTSPNLKIDLAYTGATSGTVRCSQNFTAVPLTNGVFHLKLNLNCGTYGTLTDVLSAVPVGESAAIRVTDLSNAKVYSYQAIHSMPFANVAAQLVQLNATDGQVLTWNNDHKKWEPTTLTAGGGGTVTNVSVNSPLTISNPTSAPSIGLPQANGTTSGYLSSADWNAFNNKQGSLPAGGTNAHYYRGDNSWQTLDTSVVPENANLYFTNARALEVPLAGFATATGAIVATDKTIEAFGKAQGQINSLVTDSAKYLIKNSTDSISGVVNVGTTGLLQLVYTPVGMNDATNKSYVDSEVGTKVSKTGDTMSGVLTLDNDLKIKGGTNYVTVKGHAASSNYNLFLPQTAGTAGYVLSTDGNGNTSWVNPTVNSASITNDSIVDADINSSAAIAQSKISNLTTDLAGKEPTITAGTTAQYYRGDKTFVDLGTDVRATALTGFTVGANSAIVATDTTLGAFQKVQGQIDATNTAMAGKEASLAAGTASQYYRGDKTWSTFATDVINSVLGTITPNLARIATADSVQTAFNKTQGQLDAIAAGYVSKDGTNVLTGASSVQGMTARLTVPTPLITDVTDAANVQFVKDYVGGYGLWSKNGSDVYFNSGKVGIGLDSPEQPLHISSSGSSAQLILERTGANAGKMALGSDNFGFNIFDTATYTRRMTVTSGGNVGIGTTSPFDKFTVVDSVHAKAKISGDGDLDQASLYLTEIGTLGNESGFEINFNGANGVSGNNLNFVSYAAGVPSNRLSISRDSGNVGIGTTSPMAKLQIDYPMNNGASKYSWLSGNGLLINNPSFADGGEVAKIVLNTSSGGYNSGAIIHVEGAGAYNAGQLVFSTGWDASGNATERMRIKNDGKIGIGTTTPGTTLDVAGQGRLQTTAAQVFQVVGVGTGYADSTNGVATIYSQNSVGSGGNVLKVGSAYAPNGLIVKDNGSVGIGTTNPSVKLDVAGDIKATGGGTIGVTKVSGTFGSAVTNIPNNTYTYIGDNITLSAGSWLIYYETFYDHDGTTSFTFSSYNHPGLSTTTSSANLFSHGSGLSGCTASHCPVKTTYQVTVASTTTLYVLHLMAAYGGSYVRIRGGWGNFYALKVN